MLVHNFQNEYLRMATLNILSTLDKKFSVADILCKIMPALKPYLKESVIKLRNKVRCYTLIISLEYQDPGKRLFKVNRLV